MDKWITRQMADLDGGSVRALPCAPEIAQGSAQSMVWEVAVMRCGKPADLDGGTVTAEIVRPDGQTVVLKGTRNGHVCRVVFAPECSAIPGRISGTMWVTKSSSEVMAIAWAWWTVRISSTGVIIDPGEVVGNFQAFMAELQAIRDTNAEIQAAEEEREAAEQLRREAMDDSAVSEQTHWSSKHTVDMLCSPFATSGNPVQVHPVAGYPLQVAIETDSAAPVTVVQSGKNMASLDAIGDVCYIKSDASESVRKGIRLPGGITYTCSAKEASSGAVEYIYAYIVDAQNSVQGTIYYVLSASGASPKTIPVPAGCNLLVFNGKTVASIDATKAMFEATCLQVEIGSAATAYEPYSGGAYVSATPADGTAAVEGVTAIEGVNTLFAADGVIRVTGAEDPRHTVAVMAARLAELENALIST